MLLNQNNPIQNAYKQTHWIFLKHINLIRNTFWKPSVVAAWKRKHWSHESRSSNRMIGQHRFNTKTQFNRWPNHNSQNKNHQSIVNLNKIPFNACINYYLNMDCDGETGLLDAIRNGERAGFASEATRKADLVAEDDRKIDLAAVEAIFVIGVMR